ncbi:Disease resistance protein RPV1 [Linum perenne]
MTVTYTIGGGGGQPPSTTTPPTPPPPPTKLLPKYDVFLSFRGEDLRGNFIEHLYDRLSKEPGVNAFMDDKEKPKGYPLSTLLEAINRSTMSVVVFSSGFADSKCCLTELVRIVWRVQRKVHVALPVFFHVSTRDVGKQSGSYEAAFAVHEKNESPSKVKGWRNAMTAASRLTGWTFSGKDSEVDLIKDITRNIVQRLKDNNITAGPEPEPSTHHHTQAASHDFFAYQEQEHTAVIWICRMGGYESANSAKLVYHNTLAHTKSHPAPSHANQNDTSSYSFQSHELTKKPELKWTKKLSDDINLVRANNDNKKVLAAVDGMEKLSSLVVFATKTGWFGPGSQVVISTVDQNILEVVHVDMVDDNKYYRNMYLDVACFVKDKIGGGEMVKWVEKFIAGLPSEMVVKVYTRTFDNVEKRDNGELKIMNTVTDRSELPVVPAAAERRKFDLFGLFASCLGFAPASA